MCVCAKLLQWCLILCNSMDCSPPGSSVHGILQARILEWVAMPCSRGSSQPRDQTQVSRIAADSLPCEPPWKPMNTGVGCPIPPSGDLPDLGIKLESPALQMDSCNPGFPDSSVGKESTPQCRRTGFDSWVGKIPWRRKWQPTPVFWPGEFHGQRSLVSYSPWGHKELDTTEQLKK